MLGKSYGKKSALIVLALFIIAVGAWLISYATEAESMLRRGLIAIFLITMAYVFLLSLPSKQSKDVSFLQNVKFKIPIFIVTSIILWFIAGALGFPIWWQIEFVVFAFAALVIFILLDLRTLKKEKSGFTIGLRLAWTTTLASILFITITAQLPQFDPALENFNIIVDDFSDRLEGLSDPEVIAIGRKVFEGNKCFHCHKVFWEGDSDIGPNLGTKQIGLYSKEYIKEQIIYPEKFLSPGFENLETKERMPTYYDDDLNDDELTSLIAYLKTMRDPTHIPVEGKLDNQWTWWDDPKIIEEGKLVYEGAEPETEVLSCAVCHGKGGAPLMTDAGDLRDANYPDTDKIPGDHSDKLLKDWPDALWYRRVTRGVPPTPMAPWGTIFPHLYLWKAAVYTRTFHDPLEKRTNKRPIPPIPTKEEIEAWKKDGLFLEPLL